MRLILHLGAHKTATSYIQDTLAASRRALAQRHVGYVPLEEMRRVVTPIASRRRIGLGNPVHALIEKHRTCERLILSDENLTGFCTGAVGAGGYYRQLDKRIGRLLKAIGDEEVELLFATRAYDSFVSSMYCEYLRHRPFLTIGEYLEAVDVDAFSWARVVETLCEFVGEERVTLWRYEDFRSIEDEVFAAFCGEAEGLERPQSRVRESLSAEAVASLTERARVLSREQVQALVEPVSAALPKSPERPAFEAFDSGRTAELRARYDEDIAAIARDLPRVRILPKQAPTHSSAPPPHPYVAPFKRRHAAAHSDAAGAQRRKRL